MTEVNAPSLGSRFTLKINSDEAYLLNTKKEPIIKQENIEVEISFKDILSENNFGYNEEETGTVFENSRTEIFFRTENFNENVSNTSKKGPHPWVHVKVGKFECIIYEDQSVPKYTNKKNESFNDLIQEILFPDSYGSNFVRLKFFSGWYL